jgi:hypothetical protein
MLAAGIGCQPAFGRLEGVLVDVEPEARPAETGELGRVEVTREGRQEQGRPNMPLKKGDGIITGADGIGIMVLAGYQVIMDPGTDLTIENPSIFVRIGRIIVKKIEEVAEAFTVNTEFGAAAVEGTEFIFEVNRQNVVELTVLEGRVKVFPRGSARWQDTVAYVAGERGRLDAARAARLTRLTPRVTDSLRRRIKHLEITLRPEVPDVMGLPGGEAEAELKRHGLVPLVIPVITRQAQPALRRALGQVPRVGTVVATDPPVGSRLRQGGRVRISVEQESVAVPDLMGQPYATAVQVLARAGLGVGDTTSSVQPNGVDGTVSGMGPSPGAFVAPGTRVSLTILRVAPVVERAGPVDRRVIEVVQCTVPKLGGLTEDQAKAALEQNGLKPGQISFGGGSTVTIQEPVPDTKVKCGSPVSFMVGSPIR